MELTKNLTQAKLFKSLVVIVLGSIALTISAKIKIPFYPVPMTCLLYTSDAADEEDSVDLGGRRIIKKN